MIRFCNHLQIEVNAMRKRLLHILVVLTCTVLMFGALTFGANAAYGKPAFKSTYGKMSFSSMPSNWQNMRVTVGNVTMPLSRFPKGHVSNDNEVAYVSLSELQEYGISTTSNPIWTKGTTCLGFSRHVYAALFYKYPADATMDTALGSSFENNSQNYYDVIYELYGTKRLTA